MITVYTITYNEELLTQFMIDHYRTRFPGCRMVFYDNISSDNTVAIARANDCEVISFDSQNLFKDSQNMEIKNNCWKEAQTDWVLACDLDELLDITKAELKAEEKLGTTLIRSDTYDMVNLVDNLDFASMKHGVKSPVPSKILLFNKKYISEMNFGVGSHHCNPIGKVVPSSNYYKLYHYASINPELTIAKFKERSQRLSPENIAMKWGMQVFMTPAEIRQEYAEERSKAVIVR